MSQADAPLDMKRQVLEQRLAQSQAEAYTAAINAQAARAAAVAVGVQHGASLIKEAEASELKGKAHAAAARKFAELLDALPKPDPALEN